MSLIVHRCITCTHSDIFHGSNDECCYSQCGAGRHVPVWSDPEVIPTWNCDTGALVEVIPEPGSRFTGFSRLPLDLCGCDQCRELWEQSGFGR